MTLRKLAICAAAAAFVSCGSDDWSPDVLLHGGGGREEAVLRQGRAAYETYCAGCHGEAGDGEGPASKWLDPKPRDLRKARIKFAAVPAGEMPRDDDLVRIMDHGLAGTSMPAWPLLPREEKLAIVAYVKTFSEAWSKGRPGAPVTVKPDPWRKDPEGAIAAGERLYHGLAACSSCHPAYVPPDKLAEHAKAAGLAEGAVRKNVYDPMTTASDWGAPIRPPDFLFDRVKSASTREDLVRVIAAGVGGTAMPSWGASLKQEELWSLAHYVQSLVSLRGTPEAAALRKSLLEHEPQGSAAPPAAPNNP